MQTIKLYFFVYILCYCSVLLFGADNNRITLSKDLEIKKISENVWLHISYYDMEDYGHVPANGLIIKNENSAYIVDTPWRDTETMILLDWLEDSLKVNVAGVIATHWHQDCMGGLGEVKKRGITSFACEKTIEFAQMKKRPLPDNGFQDSLALHLGDLEIICRYFGGGHTEDNIFVWIPDEKLLFGGCPVKALNWKGLGFTGDADLEEWPNTLNKVLKAYPNCDLVIPGHGDPGDLSLIHHTLELLNTHQSND
jgi:metallo-beta-lactamase class B